MNIANQGACQSQKTAKKFGLGDRMADFPNQQLVANPKLRPGTFANAGASNRIEHERSSGE
jgi:hypothetical protein